jgi:hypothetical protein
MPHTIPKKPVRSLLKERIVPKVALMSGDPLLTRSDRARRLLAKLNGTSG